MKKEAIALELEHNDISAIPPTSLWELCRQYDARVGVQSGGKYAGLEIFKHFSRVTQRRRVAHDTGS